MPQKPAENESREKLTIKILFRNLENPINQNVGQPETAETQDSAFLHKGKAVVLAGFVWSVFSDCAILYHSEILI